MLLVYHQMEYQQWVPGPQTLVTLCVMVRYNEHKCCNLFQATKFLLRVSRLIWTPLKLVPPGTNFSEIFGPTLKNLFLLCMSTVMK